MGLKPWLRHVLYVEKAEAAQRVLRSRMADGTLDTCTLVQDVREITGEQVQGLKVEMLTAGFPCQDISVAGHQRGIGTGTRLSNTTETMWCKRWGTLGSWCGRASLS